MVLISPPHLKKGDKLRIISTARFVEQEFIAKAIALLEQKGFEVIIGRHLYSRYNQFAGTDADRLEDLNTAINDEECRAIICARGGYGTARLLEGMDMKAFAKNPKWILGYSDITALHSHLYCRGFQSIHGSMPVNFAKNTAAALKSLQDALLGRPSEVTFASHTLNREGTCEGPMVGGNLSVLYSMLGSSAQMKTEGCILFLEDLDEYLYHIDRMMLALKRAGILENLAGMIVGGMTDMNDNQVPFGKMAEEIIADHVSEYDFPLAFNYPSGHIDDNRSWIHGKKQRLTVVNDQPSLCEN